jgi:hypothetical protein
MLLIFRTMFSDIMRIIFHLESFLVHIICKLLLFSIFKPRARAYVSHF